MRYTTISYWHRWCVAWLLLIGSSNFAEDALRILTLDETRIGTVTNNFGSVNFNFATGDAYRPLREALFTSIGKACSCRSAAASFGSSRRGRFPPRSKQSSETANPYSLSSHSA